MLICDSKELSYSRVQELLWDILYNLVFALYYDYCDGTVDGRCSDIVRNVRYDNFKEDYTRVGAGGVLKICNEDYIEEGNGSIFYFYVT